MYLEHLDDISCYKLLIAPSLDNHSSSSVKSLKHFSDCDIKYQFKSCVILTHVSLLGSYKYPRETPFHTTHSIITQKILLIMLNKSPHFHNVFLASYWRTSSYGMTHSRKSIKHTQKPERYSKKRGMGRFIFGNLETSLGYFYFINDRFESLMLIKNN